MSWRKLGLTFKAGGQFPWMQTHAQVPLAVPMGERTRLYFGTRDGSNRTVTAFIEVDSSRLERVLYIHDQPALDLGERGSFDDSGTMPSCIVKAGGLWRLYYTGWNVGADVPYRLAIGCAVSSNGKAFAHYAPGPVLDRQPFDPYWVAEPCVLFDSGKWRMWYLSCTRWQLYKGKHEPHYEIKYAESNDGFDWRPSGFTCLAPQSPEVAIARPCVIKDGDLYKMWFSYRGLDNYREGKAHSYRIGYAESGDGLTWQRKDGEGGLGVSLSGWDSQMVAYPWIWNHNERRYMVYSGNGFGRGGMGCAVWE